MPTTGTGKVEHSHRIDNEDFWSRHEFTTHDEAQIALRGWEQTYNHERFSMALAGMPPAEKLALRLRHPSAAEN